MRQLLAAVITASLALVSPPVADACLNETYYTLDNATGEIRDAEEALARGHWKTALKEAQAANTNAMDGGYGQPRPDEATTAERRTQLEQRRQRIMGIAHLRLGHTTVAKKLLAPLVDQQPDDPMLQARYAEVLAALGDKTEGLEMLVDLQARDVMPDAAGWLALAKLQDAAGDVEGRDVAIAGCKAMTKTKYKRNCAFKLTARRVQTKVATKP